MGSDLRTSTRTWWIIAAAAAALLLGLLQPMAPTASAAEPPADYVGVTPLRVADTRSGTGVARGKLQARTVLEVDTASASSVPVNAEAVWLNVTVTDPDAPGWLAAYPCGSTRPNASNLNFTSKQTIANAVAVAVGDSGRVCIYTAATAHVIVDLNGYFPAASAYTAGNPTRLADTRTGSGVRAGRVERGQVLTVPVGGRAGVPADAKAASLNVTVTEPATTGFVTVFPCGQSRPTASNLNFTAGQSIPNAVVAKLGEKGTICLFTSATTHLIVDVNGAYAADSVYTPRNAVRAADTRNGTGVRAGVLVGGTALPVPIAGRYGFPEEISAVTLNVTATEPRGTGWLTVYACGTPRPTASNLNFTTGQTIANAANTQVGDDGSVCVYSSTTTHVLLDVNGDYPPTPPKDTSPPDPVTDLRVTEETEESISLAWRNPAEADLFEVIVRRAIGATAPTSPTTGAKVALSSPTATSVQDRGLAPGQTYSYAVYTMDIAGNLTRQPAKVTGSTVDTTPPGPVTDLKVSGATASSVTLTWSNPASSDLDEVLVRRAKGSTPPADPAAGTAVPLADETATSATDTALLPTTSYSYAVFTRDRSGNTNPSPVTVTATTAKALAGAQVTTGFRHSCGIDAVGTAWCWGWNGFGQLGDGTVTDSSTPVKVSGDRVYDAISAGNDHTCAIDTDGAAWCWGRNSSGQLGDGTLEKRSMPVAVQGGRAFRDISGGGLQTCALATDGAAWCWGHNSDGQLGDGSTATRTTPVAVAGGHRFSEISSGLHHTCGLDASGGTVRCWGRNSSGQLGDTTTEQRTRPAAVAGTYRAVTAGDTHTCAIDTDAAAWCWGSNTAGQIGDDTISDLRSAPTAVLGGRAYSTIAGGGLHTCALATDGKPWCWGSNRYGELGVGVPIILSRTPVAVEPAGSGAFDTIAAGGGPDGGQTCGIDTAGAAWCWGWNSSGQLGDTTTEDRYSPSAVTPASG